MDSRDLIQLMQKSVHVTLGATASLVEALQDPQKREQDLSRLTRGELHELAQEWAAKGEVTQAEASTLIENLVQQVASQVSDSGQTTVTTTATPVADQAMHLELKELTVQLAELRAELARLQNQSNP